MSNTIKAILENQECMELLLEQFKGLTNVTCAYVDRLLEENEPRETIRENKFCWMCNNAIVSTRRDGARELTGRKLTVPCSGFSLKERFSNSDEAKEDTDKAWIECVKLPEDVFGEVQKHIQSHVKEAVRSLADKQYGNLSKPQPAKTYGQDFLDKFPKVQSLEYIQWCDLYGADECTAEDGCDCDRCPMWNERMEGEK